MSTPERVKWRSNNDLLPVLVRCQQANVGDLIIVEVHSRDKRPAKTVADLLSEELSHNDYEVHAPSDYEVIVTRRLPPCPERPWKLPSPDHVLECIEHWRALNLRKASDAEVVRQVRDLCDRLAHVVVQRVTKRFPDLWRVRRQRDGEMFARAADLWSPPCSIARTNRCNCAGESVLYCASETVTALDEMSVEPGERVLLIQYETDRLRLVRVVGAFDPNPLEGKAILTGDELVSYRILREFLRAEFTKPVGEGTEFLYRVSAAISRVWGESDDMDGWLYPSVRSWQGECIALKQAVEKSKVRYKAAFLARVTDTQRGRGPTVSAPGITLEQDAIAVVEGDVVTWQPRSLPMAWFRRTE